MRLRAAAIPLLLACAPALVLAEPPQPSTFSIVAADPEAGEVGVAVASRFFAVGAVVPHARAGVGAIATQSFANVSFGPRGLDLLERGLRPDEVIDLLMRTDDNVQQRQIGVVRADGKSMRFTGTDCLKWAGGRNEPTYSIQGNILAGENVVVAMEEAFVKSTGRPLAERLLLALEAGDDAGGDSRGKQSAALVVKRERAGYGGYTDQAVDIRVDDHEEPVRELGRLLDTALVWDYWNRGWTAFKKKDHAEALKWQEHTAKLAEKAPSSRPEVLYDLAVIRLANDDKEGARAALESAIRLNPKLATQAETDEDLAGLK